MLFTRFRYGKNGKGVTLLEMLAAITITAILAAVLSMMIVPVINTYTSNRIKTELRQAVTARLNDMALHLRGANGIYLSDVKRTPSKKWYPAYKDGNGNIKNTFKKSADDKAPKENMFVFPEIRYEEKGKDVRTEADGVMSVDYQKKRMYAFIMENYYEVNSPKISGYLYPEIVVADWSNSEKRWLAYGSFVDMKLQSDDYQSKDYWCPSTDSMYFYVRQNPDDANSGTVLEMHLIVKKGDVTYEGTKTIVCENLVIQKTAVYSANFLSAWSGSTLVPKAATVSTGTDSKKWTKYYTVWFTKKY